MNEHGQPISTGSIDNAHETLDDKSREIDKETTRLVTNILADIQESMVEQARNYPNADLEAAAQRIAAALETLAQKPDLIVGYMTE